MFLLANYGVLPAWLLLAVAPRSPWTRRLVHSLAPSLLLGAAYAVLLFTDMGGEGDASMFTLRGVMAIFDKPQTVVAAWIHYLVFDLFVGAWQARDAHRLGIPHLWVVPCLVGTLLFGPVGLVAYLLLRLAKGHGASLDELVRSAVTERPT